MKRLFAILLVAVMATTMAFAQPLPNNLHNYGNGSQTGSSIYINGSVLQVPITLTPTIALMNLDGVNPGEWADYGPSDKQVIFNGTCAKGYGLKITGTIDFVKFIGSTTNLDCKITTGYCVSVNGGTWSAWTPVTNADGTYTVNIPGAYTVTGAAQVAFHITKFEVGVGAPVGARQFTASVSAEYFEN
jgi:hypothetical protein